MCFKVELHKNSILTGHVDSYCLVCDNYLPTEDDAIAHKDKPIHKKNIEAATHLEKYKNDCIIKVKKGYYCTYCNILVPTITKVGLHIEESKHKENREAQIITKVGDDIVAFDEVVITLKSWNGMLENTCMICNVEFDDEDEHRIEQGHILQLFQSKYEFGDKYVYRMVDEDYFFCLICGNAYAIKEKPTHHDDTNHKGFYNSGKELKNKSLQTTETKAENSLKTVPVAEVDVATKSTDSEVAKTSTGARKKVFAAKSTAAESKVPDATKTEGAKKTKAVTKDTLGQSANNTEMVGDFIDNLQSKQVTANNVSRQANRKTDNKMSEYLDANNYIVQEDDDMVTCVLCDVTDIKNEDIEFHLNKDLHHQMMVKKNKELLKKVNGSTAETTETFPADNLVKNKGKISLNNQSGNNRTASNAKLEEKVTPSCQQVQLEKAPPLDLQSKIRQQNPDSDLSSVEDEGCKSKILDDVDIFQKNDITIDFTTERARCKRCKQDLPFDHAALKNHTKEHEAKRIAIKEKDKKDKMDAFAKENFIKVQKNDAQCTLCSVGITLNMKDMTAHVNLRSHKDKVSNRNGAGPAKKVQASEFMQTFFQVESSFGADIILNNAFVLRHLSFHCIIRQEDDGLNCALCDVEIPCIDDELAQHINRIDHKLKMGTCNVVSSVPQEFIREVTPGQYHCGYCNKVLDHWQAMQLHMQSVLHSAAKRNALWTLERCHSLIRNARPLQAAATATAVVMTHQSGADRHQRRRGRAVMKPPSIDASASYFWRSQVSLDRRKPAHRPGAKPRNRRYKQATTARPGEAPDLPPEPPPPRSPDFPQV